MCIRDSVEAATRGNGEVGEAILPQVRTIRCVPLSYAVKFIDLTREQQMDVISRTCHANM